VLRRSRVSGLKLGYRASIIPLHAHCTARESSTVVAVSMRRADHRDSRGTRRGAGLFIDRQTPVTTIAITRASIAIC
jgi:hypothetical protein